MKNGLFSGAEWRKPQMIALTLPVLMW